MAADNNSQNGISGSTLKLIAILTMLIDHIAAINIYGGVAYNSSDELKVLYYIMRLIGRIAFPIFAFLLVEGFTHTGNKYRYLGRLIALAFISELPFDFAFNLSSDEIVSGRLIELKSQNVFVTLAIGLSVMIIVDGIDKSDADVGEKRLWNITILAAGMLLAYFMRSDYGALGVAVIFIIYTFRTNPRFGLPAGVVLLTLASPIEASAFFACIPIARYDGTRGINLKWIFYLFYPIHLLVLWAISMFL